MLHDERTANLLGEDFVNYLQVKFADPDGINQRNKVSHQLSPLVDFSHRSSISLIQIICKISQFSVNQSN